MEDRMWKPYNSQGLQVVAIDANGDDPTGLKWYVDNRHVTYPVGMEDVSTKTYAAFTANYKGLNPFPVDVVVGKDGLIKYVAREYDAAALEAVVKAELAK